MITNKGRILWANAEANLRNGWTGTLKEATATTLTVASTPWTAEQFVGQDVYTGESVGTILSNTSSVLTVARWERLPSTAHPTYNRSEVGAEPVASAAYSIVSGATPAAWMAVTKNSEAPKETSESLPEEVNKGQAETSEYGLVRKLCTFTYLGGKEYKVEAEFTAKKKDPTPIVLAKIGIFNAQHNGVLLFESLLSATAEIKEEGDAITISDTVTGS